MLKCPCGSNKDFSKCCEQFISGIKVPKTAEELMRSRYCAYSLGNIDYIEKTMLGKALENFDIASTKQWAESVTWLGLTVINATKDTVEFIAKFKDQDKENIIYELSHFNFIDGKWYFTDGKTPKVKRNDPCPCKSGKKAKRCCFL